MRNLTTFVEKHLSTFLLSFVCRTIDIKEENRWFVQKRVFRKKKGAIFCLWHNRLFYMTHYVASTFYYNYPHVSVLASSSRDGRKIANVIDVLGGDVIWGSSSRKSRKALRKAVRHARDDQALFLTPDGPRGPRYEVQKGLAFIARASRQPIIPVTYGVSDFVQLNSWDRFIIPYPFTEGVVRFGEPIWPGEHSGDTNELRDKIQSELNALDSNLRGRGVDFD